MNGAAYRFGQKVGGLSRVARKAAEYLTALLFCTLFFSFVSQIFMRYALNSPLNWSEELSIICYMWIVFVACSFTLRDGQHVIFTIVAQSLPRRARTALAIASSLVIVVMLLWVSYGIADYVMFMKVEKTPALFLRKDYVFSIFVVFIAMLVLRCLWTIFTAVLELSCQKTHAALIAGFDETAGFVDSGPREAAP
ncbi:MAG: TRAP transporter small permease [Candidatus Accumulibacter sp.]|jgi:TRAP-type C4-dicarboxylate transport system permease small subunit|nr:TRAP transporter small permease [Accumulibacter sp.]